LVSIVVLLPLLARRESIYRASYSSRRILRAPASTARCISVSPIESREHQDPCFGCLPADFCGPPPNSRPMGHGKSILPGPDACRDTSRRMGAVRSFHPTTSMSGS
jgi:hypothetical protein